MATQYSVVFSDGLVGKEDGLGWKGGRLGWKGERLGWKGGHTLSNGPFGYIKTSQVSTIISLK